MDLNKVSLIGDMVRDVETATLRNKTHVARFSLATLYAWQDPKTKARKEAVDFHSCIAWGKLGDIVQQYVKKGSKLYVEGRLRNRVYIARDGSRRSTVEIVVDNLIMLGHRTQRTAAAPANDKLVREDVDVDELE
jgi:single-strand DNA-binding protein